jgi:hypothetical protein
MVPFYLSSALVSICMVLLPEGQLDEASELSKKQRSFEIPGALDRKVLAPYFSLWGLMLS